MTGGSSLTSPVGPLHEQMLYAEGPTVGTATDVMRIEVDVRPRDDGVSRGFYRARVPVIGLQSSYRMTGHIRVLSPANGDWNVWVDVEGQLIERLGVTPRSRENFDITWARGAARPVDLEVAWSERGSTTLLIEVTYDW